MYSIIVGTVSSTYGRIYTALRSLWYCMYTHNLAIIKCPLMTVYFDPVHVSTLMTVYFDPCMCPH